MAAGVAAALRGVSTSGVPVTVLVGNRDFLLRDRFAAATGATVLPERTVVDVAGVPALLLHGDELCTGDVGYQRVRALVRNRRRQAVFLALPYAMRRGIAAWMRRKSAHATAAKPEAILDVAPEAVEAAFREAGVARMIHGHTHRPAHHRLTVDGRERERIVLADWYDRGSYLEVDAAGARSRDVVGPIAGGRATASG